MSELFDIPTRADFIRSFADAGTVDRAPYGIPFLAGTPRSAPPPVLCGTGGGKLDGVGAAQTSCSYAGSVRKSA
ncbi:hypothetical protein ACFCX0_17190 [Streptomyces sp. NPDC056352]|uniref:hypothetical protein n=1 Tax=Streptomyces sp. NPDC056352 TaxID=3345791 RepID=UPI0035DE378E